MPVGLQIIGRRLEEEKTIAMTDAILRAVQKPSVSREIKI
jgi:Asp-tRNA(Asn)/Glu-tRNA(Gln) amidotransferase A subunit family amidase